MSKINDLIKELCPNGVEYKKLKDVCNFQNGYAFKSNLFKNDGDVLLRITNIDGKKIDLTDLKYIDVNDYNTDLSQFVVKNDDIVIAMSGATTGKIGINSTGKNLYLNQRVGKITPKDNLLNNHFLYHFLLTKVDYFYKLAGGGAQPNLSSEDIKKTLVPIPPIEVQKEIVRILDKFGELEAKLEAKLEAELETRKSQYEFWRKKLLDIDEKFLKLGELCSIKTGSKPKEINDIGNFEYINAGTSNSGYTNATNAKGNCVTTPSRGQGGIGFIGFQENDFWCGPLCYQIRSQTDKLLDKYLYYYMLTNANYILSLKHEGGVPAVNIKELQEMPIVVPLIEKQQRTIKILDKFDKLINDISIGLPAEIEARRKQYEYYRNKLLSFEELKNE